jgi:hypothetical protein
VVLIVLRVSFNGHFNCIPLVIRIDKERERNGGEREKGERGFEVSVDR